MSNTYIAYRSNSYVVVANGVGVEITNLHSGITVWLQGDESNKLREEIDFYASDDRDDRDHYLSQYFGG